MSNVIMYVVALVCIVLLALPNACMVVSASHGNMILSAIHMGFCTCVVKEHQLATFEMMTFACLQAQVVQPPQLSLLWLRQF